MLNSDQTKIPNKLAIKKNKQLLVKKNKVIDQLKRKNSKLLQQVSNSHAYINKIQSSKFWKLRNYYIKVKQPILNPIKTLKKIRYKFDAFKFHIQREGLYLSLIRTYNFIIHGKGKINRFEKQPSSEKARQKKAYQEWIKKNEQYNPKKIKKSIRKFQFKPKISVITPVYNVDPKWLRLAVNSFLNQYYNNCELCLYDDASTNISTRQFLQALKNENHPNIKIRLGKVNQNISIASNQAIKMASGEYICLLDHDDELAPHALFEIVKTINQYPKVDYIYSDEDKIDETGQRCDPYFKPNWNIDFFFTNNYTCHLSVFRKSIIEQINGFRTKYNGSQDYDLVLRYITKAKSIQHIPKILYHWRKIPGSTAQKSESKDYTSDAGLKALQDNLSKHSNIEIKQGKIPNTYRVIRNLTSDPLVSIIIPFKDKPDILKKCLDSIIEKTSYKNYEIICVSNNSTQKETVTLMESFHKKHNVRFLQYNVPFNYSKINNFATKFAKGEHLLFLNNDTEVINANWLFNLLEHSVRRKIGAVGAKLLYPDETIQHAGVIIGLGGIAEHSHKKHPNNENGYFNTPHLTQLVSAVTGACLMIKKELFNSVGGFDDKNLSIAYNDVDLCLRLIEKNYKNVYTPYAILYHHESFSRGKDKNDSQINRFKKESNFMIQRHKRIFKKGDYYYNQNLNLNRQSHTIKEY